MCFAGLPMAEGEGRPTGGGAEAGTLLLRVALEPSLTLGLFAWDVVTLPGSAYAAGPAMPGSENSALPVGLDSDSGASDRQGPTIGGPQVGLMPHQHEDETQAKPMSTFVPQSPHPFSVSAQWQAVQLPTSGGHPDNMNDEVILVASTHCGRSLHSAREDKACRIVLVKVSCDHLSSSLTPSSTSKVAPAGTGAASLTSFPSSCAAEEVTDRGTVETSASAVPVMRVVWQWTRVLPSRFDHANMMCVDAPPQNYK